MSQLEVNHFVKRNIEWLKKKNKRLINLRKSQDKLDFDQCTFKPNSAKINSKGKIEARLPPMYQKQIKQMRKRAKRLISPNADYRYNCVRDERLTMEDKEEIYKLPGSAEILDEVPLPDSTGKKLFNHMI